MPIKTYCFTSAYPGKSNILINEVNIAKAYHPDRPHQNINYKKFQAIWDTGATNTVITKKVVEECGLIPTGMTKVCTASGETIQNTYLVNILLVNKVEVYQLRVTEGVIIGPVDVLVGMDIIGNGDFAVTNKDGKTVFTFRFPSIERIDFVQNPYKENPLLAPQKIGRNVPCPCGSGKKYKNCCMNKTSI